MRIERIDVSMHHVRRVAGRVDTDEQDACVIGQRSQSLHHHMQMGQGQWADIGAMGVAEIQHYHLAAIVGSGDRLAVIVGEIEVEIRHVATDIGQPQRQRLAALATAQQQAGGEQQQEQGGAR
jgi:hypothetical protein